MNRYHSGGLSVYDIECTSKLLNNFAFKIEIKQHDDNYYVLELIKNY